jgi:hypothetical protein
MIHLLRDMNGGAGMREHGRTGVFSRKYTAPTEDETVTVTDCYHAAGTEVTAAPRAAHPAE